MLRVIAKRNPERIGAMIAALQQAQKVAENNAKLAQVAALCR